ncbi:MAG TPA: O-antigen ligase family protein [Bacteroidales bacterium]|nr:O-antigen ligase family protein [Bacteroidales bacterium]
MNSLKRIFLVLFLLYVSGLPQRLGFVSQVVNEIVIMVVALTGLFFFSVYLSKYRYRIEMLDIYLSVFLIFYPVFNCLVAYFTVGQPLYMGLLSFRSLYLLLAFYTLYCFDFNERAILSYVNMVNILVLIVVVILFFGFSVNDFNTVFRKGTLAVRYTFTTTKGIQFSGFSGLFFISFIAGWVYFFEKNKPGNLILPLVILLSSVFITKSRNEIFSLCMIPVMMYYLKYKLYDLKFLSISVTLILALYLVMVTDNVISRSFTGLLHANNMDYIHQTRDYSAYLRIREIEDGWKWFLKYPLTGLGSISYRYNGGYMGIVSDFFFISDIGIFGLLVKGGIILVLLYIMFFIRLFRYFSGDGLIVVIGRYLLFFILIELIIGNDLFYNNTGVMVIMFMLKPSRDGITRSVYA